MITTCLKIAIVIYLCYTIYYIHRLIQYDNNATLVTLDQWNQDKLSQEVSHKNPVCWKVNDYKHTFTFQEMNQRIPGYMIQDTVSPRSLNYLLQSPQFAITHRPELIIDFQLQPSCKSIQDLFQLKLACRPTYDMSLFRGTNYTQLYKQQRELCILQVLQGSAVVYMFNPKHEREIKGLPLQSIKKWAIKTTITPEYSVSIPPEWYYFYETSEDTSVIRIQSDTAMSVLYNLLREQ